MQNSFDEFQFHLSIKVFTVQQIIINPYILMSSLFFIFVFLKRISQGAQGSNFIYKICDSTSLIK